MLTRVIVCALICCGLSSVANGQSKGQSNGSVEVLSVNGHEALVAADGPLGRTYAIYNSSTGQMKVIRREISTKPTKVQTIPMRVPSMSPSRTAPAIRANRYQSGETVGASQPRTAPNSGAKTPAEVTSPGAPAKPPQASFTPSAASTYSGGPITINNPYFLNP